MGLSVVFPVHAEEIRERSGALNLRIIPFAGNSERQSFVRRPQGDPLRGTLTRRHLSPASRGEPSPVRDPAAVLYVRTRMGRTKNKMWYE
ncbi:hypothetical protein EVAR_4837_1 [Eumeta japonica]|uniref:Uncharacterized protein n=1 Tax=Eumeta variegata TaxID=151549 RepID=A0A4C1T029_EUMVA|nr:hypothetical protein EVAR_4837_1 [Eumeta japonica]